MTIRLLLALTLTVFLTNAGSVAFAKDAACVASCQQQEDDCSADANQAIDDGTFSDHQCTGYQSCANVIKACEATTRTCKQQC